MDDVARVELLCQEQVVLRGRYNFGTHRFLKPLEVARPDLVPPGCVDVRSRVVLSKVNEWWQRRAIPTTRDGYGHLMQVTGRATSLSLLEESRGLSLSDQFWMRREESGETWAGLNFFDNGFSDALGRAALGETVEPGAFFSPSPNAALVGDLQKAWEIRDGRRVLVKAGRAPFDQQPYNELIATRLFSRLMDPSDYVPYELELRDGRPLSVCPNMVGSDECLVHAWDIVRSRQRLGHESMWMHLLACCERLGLHAERELTRMFTCDYILANGDRHWNNIGVIFDAATMRAKRVAPIYDTGSCLWHNVASFDLASDFDYQPKPLVGVRRHGTRPEEQLDLFTDFGWFDPALLAGFPEEVGEVLSSIDAMSEERVGMIVSRVAANIRRIEKQALKFSRC